MAQPVPTAPLPSAVFDPQKFVTENWGEVVLLFTEHLPMMLALLILTALGTWVGAVFFYRWRIDNLKGEKDNLKGEISNLNSRLHLKEDDIARLTQLLKEATDRKQIETAISLFPPNTLFQIEQYSWELHWSEQDKGELNPFHPEIAVPDNATLTLFVQVKITSAPRRRVEKIELELSGQSPLSPIEEWQPQLIDIDIPRLYFRIPSFLPNGKYSATLIATVKEKESERPVRALDPFDVILTRSYYDLPKQSSDISS